MRKSTRSFVSLGPLENLSMSRFSGPLPLSQSILIVHTLYHLSGGHHHHLLCRILHGVHATGDSVVITKPRTSRNQKGIA